MQPGVQSSVVLDTKQQIADLSVGSCHVRHAMHQSHQLCALGAIAESPSRECGVAVLPGASIAPSSECGRRATSLPHGSTIPEEQVVSDSSAATPRVKEWWCPHAVLWLTRREDNYQSAMCIPCVSHTHPWLQPRMDRLSPCSLAEVVSRFSPASSIAESPTNRPAECRSAFASAHRGPGNSQL